MNNDYQTNMATWVRMPVWKLQEWSETNRKIAEENVADDFAVYFQRLHMDLQNAIRLKLSQGIRKRGR